MRAFWRGNGTNVVRIFPYSAVQFSMNDACKRLLASQVGFLPSFPALYGVRSAGGGKQRHPWECKLATDSLRVGPIRMHERLLSRWISDCAWDATLCHPPQDAVSQA